MVLVEGLQLLIYEDIEKLLEGGLKLFDLYGIITV